MVYWVEEHTEFHAPVNSKKNDILSYVFVILLLFTPKYQYEIKKGFGWFHVDCEYKW